MRNIGLTIDSCIVHWIRHHTHRSVTVRRLHDNRPTCERGSNP
jgi:hypothetical protein